MAIKLSDKLNTDPIDSDYPYGNIRDRSGSTPGTSVNKTNLADFHQFFERLMDQAGLAHNGLADNATNGFQLFEALCKHFVRSDDKLETRTVKVPFGPWNMDTTSTLMVSFPTGATAVNIITADAIIITEAFGGVVREKLSNAGGLTWGDGDAPVGKGSNAFLLSRDASGTYDSADYNAATGYIYVTFEAQNS